MKRILLLSTVLLMAVASFASTKPVPNVDKKFVPTAFEFVGSVGQENDPLKYVEYFGDPATLCPSGTTKICAMLVSNANLIYTQAEADASSSDRILNSWVGQPKVDIPTLSTDIATALSVSESGNHTYTGTNVIIYKKN